ncbi:MAG: hypothetical protein U0J65_07860 [Christensenellales bacterium]|nr:hypothetical protein [Christensenellales bacterium]
MLKALKLSVLFFAFMLFFDQIALADRDVFLPVSQSKISQEEAEEVLIGFFSQRCNLPYECVEHTIREKETECSLRFGYFGYGHIEHSDTTPVWEAHLQLHGGEHYALFDSEGEILYWQSHGTEHHRNEPDVWENAVSATPLSTDASEEQILSDIKKRLAETTAYTQDEIREFDYRIRFVYESHFNEGHIPVWLTYVYDGGTLVCKQANGYDGSLMGMSPPTADFCAYRTNLPSFGDTMGFPYSAWYEGTMTIEEKAIQAERWRPVVEQWLKDYPYSADSLGLAYDVTIRQTFGIPNDQAISQRHAEEIARAYAPHLGISERFADLRECTINYLVTDPEKPIWRIIVKTPNIPSEEKKKYRGVDESIFVKYVVEVNACTGEVTFATTVGADTPAYLWQY